MKAQVDLPLPSVWIVKAKISLYILIKEENQVYPEKIFSVKIFIMHNLIVAPTIKSSKK